MGEFIALLDGATGHLDGATGLNCGVPRLQRRVVRCREPGRVRDRDLRLLPGASGVLRGGSGGVAGEDRSRTSGRIASLASAFVVPGWLPWWPMALGNALRRAALNRSRSRIR